MSMRLRGMSLIAAVAVAGAGVIASAPVANAAVSPDSTKLCSGASRCTIGYSFGASAKGVNEGDGVTPVVTAAPNTTVTLAVFSVQDGKLVKLAGSETTVTTTAQGTVSTPVKVPQLKAPVTGGDHFIVQPADATDPNNLIGDLTGKVPTFEVNSGRAEVTKVDEGPFTPGSQYFVRLGSGIVGDHYLMQVQVDGQWKTLNADDTTGTIKLGAADAPLATLAWKAPTLANGTYPVRVLNSRNNEVVWTNSLVFGGSTTAPTTSAKPTTSTKPTTSSKPTTSTKPSATTAPKKDTSGGLAKTGR